MAERTGTAGRLTNAVRPPVGKPKNEWNLVTNQTLERMLGYKTVAAGVAGPEIADDVVGQVG